MAQGYVTHHVRDSYIGVLLLALGAGFLVPEVFAPLEPWSALTLQAIFFLTSLRIELTHVWRELRDWPAIALVSFFMLIVLPLLAYSLARAVSADFALAILLLSAMPVGMTSPLLVQLFGLNTSLALVLTLVTSLFAPVTIPLVIGAVLETGGPIDLTHLFATLVYVIFIPFILAQVVRRLAPFVVPLTRGSYKIVSLTLVGCLIAAIAAHYRADFLAHLDATYFLGLVALSLFFLAVHLAGYWLTWWRNERDRLTVVLCVVYMNFTLAIFIAQEFFPDPEVVFYTILSILPWNIGLILFRRVVSHV